MKTAPYFAPPTVADIEHQAGGIVVENKVVGRVRVVILREKNGDYRAAAWGEGFSSELSGGLSYSGPDAYSSAQRWYRTLLTWERQPATEADR